MWGVLVCEDMKKNSLEDFVEIIWIKEGSKSNFQLPWTKNTTNWNVEMWSSSVQIFHTLTWLRKIATAAAEWRNLRPARVRWWRGRGSEALPHWRRWSSGSTRVWEARAGVRSSGVKEKWGRGGVFIATVKNGSPEEFGRTCPWLFSFAWHVSPMYWEVEIVCDRGWMEYIVGCRTVWASKPKI